MSVLVDRLVTTREVEEMIPCSHKQLYLMIQSGQFPAPIYLAERMPRWRLSTIESWLKSLERKSRRKPAEKSGGRRRRQAVQGAQTDAV